eukprot:5713137-Alexandrium_andersonii.AAC.1
MALSNGHCLRMRAFFSGWSTESLRHWGRGATGVGGRAGEGAEGVLGQQPGGLRRLASVACGCSTADS